MNDENLQPTDTPAPADQAAPEGDFRGSYGYGRPAHRPDPHSSYGFERDLVRPLPVDAKERWR